MNWVAILKALIQLSLYISKYIHDDHLMKTGEALALNKQLEALSEKLKLADKARIDSLHDSESGGLYNTDGYKRD